jgi:hypothetical protein
MESFMNGKESKPTDRRMTEARIRPIPTGLVRVRQPEELLIRPETDPERFHPVNVVHPADVVHPDALSRPTVTAEQLSKALENLKTNLRNERQAGGEFQPRLEHDKQVGEFQPRVHLGRAVEFRPAVNVGTR